MTFTVPGRAPAALSGVVAAAVALGVGELAAAPLAAAPSPVVAVGRLVIDVAPRSVREEGISAFGTADKPALVFGTIVVVLAIGALLGIRSRRSPALAPVAFGAFGLLGVLAASRDPTTAWPLTTGVAVVAAASGVIALRRLLQLAAAVGDRVPERQDAEHRGRPRYRMC